MSTKKKRPSGNPARGQARTHAPAQGASEREDLIEAIALLPRINDAGLVYHWWDVFSPMMFNAEADPVVMSMCIQQLLEHPKVPVETLVELHSRCKLSMTPGSYALFWRNLDLLWSEGRSEPVALDGSDRFLPPEAASAMAAALLLMVQRSENTAMLDELWGMARRHLLFSETTPTNLQTLVDAFESNPSSSDAVTAQAMQSSAGLA